MSVMLTGVGNVLGVLSVTFASDCTAPDPTLTEIAFAAAAATAGGELTVESTLACGLATLAKSAELAIATRHDRSNHMAPRVRTRARE